jgi:hypothetical protein
VSAPTCAAHHSGVPTLPSASLPTASTSAPCCTSRVATSSADEEEEAEEAPTEVAEEEEPEVAPTEVEEEEEPAFFGEVGGVRSLALVRSHTRRAAHHSGVPELPPSFICTSSPPAPSNNGMSMSSIAASASGVWWAMPSGQGVRRKTSRCPLKARMWPKGGGVSTRLCSVPTFSAAFEGH